jgi:hypothetical protein
MSVLRDRHQVKVWLICSLPWTSDLTYGSDKNIRSISELATGDVHLLLKTRLRIPEVKDEDS